ncbi:hypothetical protein [Duck adenovirus 1]|uniref:Uncharacterized protein n=2 Tax=Duck atadenovirus A TaxID=130328 RepID=S5RWK5_DADV1|nr:hypothetical protein [Duck adenovirus 1]QOS14204.1 hypothetical protein [Duck atadenovirus A]AJA72407.1 hypothetical protein [Duck adenovirus 1]AJA72436.1 hypothetical protein [Duck adenovirus 1]WIA59702.1 hypothetical protein [Duck atadenovirus A]
MMPDYGVARSGSGSKSHASLERLLCIAFLAVAAFSAVVMFLIWMGFPALLSLIGDCGDGCIKVNTSTCLCYSANLRNYTETELYCQSIGGSIAVPPFGNPLLDTCGCKLSVWLNGTEIGTCERYNGEKGTVKRKRCNSTYGVVCAVPVLPTLL